MSEEAVQTAAPQTQTQVPAYNSGDALRSAMAEHIAQQQPQTRQQVQTEPVQQEQVSTQSAQAAAETQAETQTQDPNKPARPWDKLGKAPEAKPANGEEFGDKPPEGDKAQNAWTTIKKRVKEYEAKEQTWAKQQQEWEQKLKEYEGRTSEFKPEMLERLKRYEEEEAINHVQRTTDYLERAQKPWDESQQTLREVAEYTGLSVQELQKALQNPNRLMRNEELALLLEKEGVREMSEARKLAIINDVFQAGEKANQAAQAHKELTDQAHAKKEQRDMAQKAEQMKAKEESQKVLKAAATEVQDGMKVSFQDLIEAGHLKAKELEFGDLQPSSDPIDVMFGEYSANLLTVLAPKYRAALAKISELEADRKERMGTNPSVRPTRTNGAPAKYDAEGGLRQAMQEHLANRANGGAF